MCACLAFIILSSHNEIIDLYWAVVSKSYVCESTFVGASAVFSPHILSPKGIYHKCLFPLNVWLSPHMYAYVFCRVISVEGDMVVQWLALSPHRKKVKGTAALLFWLFVCAKKEPINAAGGIIIIIFLLKNRNNWNQCRYWLSQKRGAADVSVWVLSTYVKR